MSREPEFSIVVPTYNRVNFLQQALSSIWAQTHGEYEIIVVDDGSTDRTEDFLASLGGRVKTVRQVDRGPAAARNLGVMSAKGEYVAFLDSDDVWFPWTLATYHKLIEKYRPSLICAATSEFEGEVSNVAQANLAAESFCDYFATADNPGYVGSGALVVKRSIFDWASGFDEGISVGEDLDFYFRVGTIENFVRVLSPVTIAYRRHAGNISRAPLSLYCAAIELLMRETEGRYPGGLARQKERWKLLSRMVRPVALSCLDAGFRGEAWKVYRQSFLMNARLGRFRFLGWFLLYDVLAFVSGSSNWMNSARPPSRTESHGYKRHNS